MPSRSLRSGDVPLMSNRGLKAGQYRGCSRVVGCRRMPYVAVAQPGAMPPQQVPLHRHRPWSFRRPVEGRLHYGP